MHTIASLFATKPFQWGLRGDPGLWETMKQHFATTPLPASCQQLETVLLDTFTTIMGADIHSGRMIYNKLFDKGGMSRGNVSCNWWLTKGIPLLKQRYEQVKLHGTYSFEES